MAVVCCGSVPEETEGFFIPFRLSAKYLGMEYVGDMHSWIADRDIEIEVEKRINDFTGLIQNNFQF